MSEAEKTLEVEDVLSSIRRLVAERPKPVEVAVQAPSVEEYAEINTPDLPQPEANDFVDTINASIAKITEENNVEPSEAPTQEDELSANVDAFVANETAQIIEEPQPVTEKAEPFVLRADMAAVVTETEPERPVSDFSQNDPTDSGPEAAFQDIPEDVEERPYSQGMAEDVEAIPCSEDDGAEDADIIEAAAPDQDALFVDEDTLREIVSELVRSELQGDLGDRITRNVRKLVRREIHHALASRNFT